VQDVFRKVSLPSNNLNLLNKVLSGLSLVPNLGQQRCDLGYAVSEKRHAYTGPGNVDQNLIERKRYDIAIDHSCQILHSIVETVQILVKLAVIYYMLRVYPSFWPKVVNSCGVEKESGCCVGKHYE
jgi:hypothetical protein